MSLVVPISSSSSSSDVATVAAAAAVAAPSPSTSTPARDLFTEELTHLTMIGSIIMDAIANKAAFQSIAGTSVYRDIMTILQKVLRDDDNGYRLSTGKAVALMNPENAVSFPDLFVRHLKGTVARSTWVSFIREHKSAFQKVNEHVQLVRRQRRAGGGGSAPPPAPARARRVGAKSSAAAAMLESSSTETSAAAAPAAAAVTPAPAAPAPAPAVAASDVLEWRAVQRDMEAQVVAFQNRPPSPPRPPRPPAAATTIPRRHVVAAAAGDGAPPLQQQQQQQLTPSEALQNATFVVACTSERVSLAGLFEVFDTDRELMPSTYAPPFDRNDLYFTNAQDARRLFALDDAVAKAVAGRVKQGLPAVDAATFPYLYIVALRFCGAPAVGLKECSYITWCLKSDYASFLGNVLSDGDGAAAVVCNAEITKLVQACTSAFGAEHRNKLFTLDLIDDSFGTINHRSIAVFLATLTGYVDQYGTPKTKGGVCANLTHVIPHGRHRLIFESGSLAAFRINWLYARNMSVVVAELAGLHASLARCVDTVITFYNRYHHHLTTSALSLGSSSAVTRAAHEVNCLWDLFQHQFGKDVLGHLTEVGVKFMMLKEVWRERRESVHSAYATAQVHSVREHAAIPLALVQAYEQTLDDAEYRRVLNSYAETTKMMRDLVAVKQKMIDAWPEVHEKLREPVGIFTLLRSLVVLQLWEPSCVVVADAPPTDRDADAAAATAMTRPHSVVSWAAIGDDDGAVLFRCEELQRVVGATAGPPKHISRTAVRQAYHRAIREDHPDKCPDAEKVDATARVQAINFAYELVAGLYADDDDDDAMVL